MWTSKYSYRSLLIKILHRYHLLVQVGNINRLYKEKKINENLTSDAVNSKMKQEVFVKNQISRFKHGRISKQRKTIYLKARDNTRDCQKRIKEKYRGNITRKV